MNIYFVSNFLLLCLVIFFLGKVALWKNSDCGVIYLQRMIFNIFFYIFYFFISLYIDWVVIICMFNSNCLFCGSKFWIGLMWIRFMGFLFFILCLNFSKWICYSMHLYFQLNEWSASREPIGSCQILDALNYIFFHLLVFLH